MSQVIEHDSLRLEGEDTLIEDNNEYYNLKGVLMIEFASPKEPKCDNSRFHVDDGDSSDHICNVLSLGSCFDSYITLPTCVFPYVYGAMYDEIRLRKEEITLSKCTPMLGNLINQVISFHYYSQVENFLFEYDAKGKRTCFWINHDH